LADLSLMYHDKGPSRVEKCTLAVLHGSVVVAAGWLLFGGGVPAVARQIGLSTAVGPPLRRALLLAAGGIYYLRTLVTMFVFLRRRMRWNEVAMIAIWIGSLQLMFAFFGGRNDAPLGLVAAVGVLLYVIGSCLNTGSEFQRYRWKQHPEHTGQLFTGGLFRLAMHVNYFGDLVLFTGWVLLTGRWYFGVVPVLMFCGFAFANVPALDRYLAKRYGEAFQQYAARTKKLIPFLY